MAKKKRKQKKSFDISNKMLATFVVLATIVSVIGLFSVQRETNLTIYDSGIMFTGMTGTNETIGNVTATIQSYTYINFTNLSIGWGSGYVQSGATRCDLSVDWDGTGQTLGSAGPDSCSGFSLPITGLPLVIENLGNEDVALNLSFSDTGFNVFGGDGNGQILYRVFQGEGYGTCLNNTGGTDTMFTFEMPPAAQINYSTWNTVAFANDNVQVCQWFNSSSANNQINIGVNFSVPSDSTQGAKTLTITAYGRTCDAVDGTTETHLNCTATNNETYV